MVRLPVEKNASTGMPGARVRPFNFFSSERQADANRVEARAAALVDTEISCDLFDNPVQFRRHTLIEGRELQGHLLPHGVESRQGRKAILCFIAKEFRGSIDNRIAVCIPHHRRAWFFRQRHARAAAMN